MTPDIHSYIRQHEASFLERLGSLIRIPSISAQPEHRADMTRCAERWRELLLEAGADRAEVMPTAGHPVVFAEKRVAGAERTVLVYGHYDVMPAEPLELWQTEPFEPTIVDGRLYARGADDDKGQTMIQLAAFEYLVASGQLRHNVKFILEGEEEMGSPSLSAFMESHRELLRCDVILVSDTSMLSADLPSITTGLRGLAYWQVEVTGPSRDLHSGHFGGAVTNPATALCQMLASVVDDDGHIRVPGFYDDVEEIPAEERAMVASIPFDEEAYMKNIGVKALSGERGFSTIERSAYRPAFDVCGLWGGYMGEGAKTVIPARAFAKISCRLVPHQRHEHIAELMAAYLQSVAPAGVSVTVRPLHGGQGYVCPLTLPAYRAAERAFCDAFGRKPIAVRRGGSIPIVSEMERVLGVKTILMGFGLESNAIHSPGESFPLDMYRRGIVAVAAFHQYYDEA